MTVDTPVFEEAAVEVAVEVHPELVVPEPLVPRLGDALVDGGEPACVVRIADHADLIAGTIAPHQA